MKYYQIDERVKRESGVYRGKYFITSRLVEGRRKFTIKRYDDDGIISVFGNPDGFGTRWSAARWIFGLKGA